MLDNLLLPESPLDYLITRGKLGRDEIESALRASDETGEPVELALLDLGLVSEDDLVWALSRTFGLQTIGAEEFPAEPVLTGINGQFLKSFQVLPIAVDEAGLILAMALPGNDYAAEAMASFADRPVTRVVAGATAIGAALERLYPE